MSGTGRQHGVETFWHEVDAERARADSGAWYDLLAQGIAEDAFGVIESPTVQPPAVGQAEAYVLDDGRLLNYPRATSHAIGEIVPGQGGNNASVTVNYQYAPTTGLYRWLYLFPGSQSATLYDIAVQAETQAGSTPVDFERLAAPIVDKNGWQYQSIAANPLPRVMLRDLLSPATEQYLSTSIAEPTTPLEDSQQLTRRLPLILNLVNLGLLPQPAEIDIATLLAASTDTELSVGPVHGAWRGSGSEMHHVWVRDVTVTGTAPVHLPKGEFRIVDTQQGTVRVSAATIGQVRLNQPVTLEVPVPDVTAAEPAREDILLQLATHLRNRIQPRQLGQLAEYTDVTEAVLAEGLEILVDSGFYQRPDHANVNRALANALADKLASELIEPITDSPRAVLEAIGRSVARRG